MAEDKGGDEHGTLVAVTTAGEVEVVAGSAMPPVEVGHKGYSLNSGKIWDPNAARRHQEGRGPGLQDSEIKDPAHWAQDVDPLVAIDREIEQLERELDAKKQQKKDMKG